MNARRHFAWVLVLASLGACGSPGDPPPATPPEPPAEPTAPPAPVAAEEPPEAAAVRAVVHAVLLVVVHEAPLLPSEQRIHGVIAERLRLRGVDVLEREATEDETAALAPYWAEDGGAHAPLPATLAATTAVLVLRVPEPRTLADGQPATRGIAGVLAFRAHDDDPYFELRVDDTSSWRLPEERWSAWLLSLLRAELPS